MIKRPLIWVLGAYMTGMLLAWFEVPRLCIIILIIFYCSSLVLLMFGCKKAYIHKKDCFLLSLPLLLLLGLYGMKIRMEPAVADSAFGEEAPCILSGEITMVVEKPWGRALYVKNNRINLGEFQSYLIENILIYCSDEQIYRIGNKITVSGKLQKFSVASNPGQFNERNYYKIQNIDYKVRADEITITDSGYSSFHNYLDRIKERFLRVYETILPQKEAGAIIAMLLGEKYLLDEEVKQLYQENGISHILAISGLHISLIGAAVYSLLRKLKAGLLPATFLSILLVYCYGVLTNFTVSTNRAVVMFVILLMARIFGKTYDMLSALSLSAFLILLQNPLQIFHAGFLLSFGAVLGLAVLLPCFHILLPIRHPLLDAVLISTSAQIMTLPMLLIFFYQLPVYSIFVNLLILPSSSALILTALAAGMIGMVSLPLGVFFIGETNYILIFYEWLCRLGSRLPGNLYTTGRPDTLRILAYALLLAAFLYGSHRIRKKIVLILPVLAVALMILPKGEKDFTVAMLDVGQGDAIYMESTTGTTYLVDGGSADISRVGINRIQPFLLHEGVDQIYYAIVTHADDDHVSGLKELIEGDRIRIRNLVLPMIEIDADVKAKIESTLGSAAGKVSLTEKEKTAASYLDLDSLARKNGITVLYIKAGDMIRDGKLSIECLHPSEGYAYSSSNSYSTVLSVTYGEFDMLLTGDLEQDGEELIMEKWMQTNDGSRNQPNISRNQPNGSRNQSSGNRNQPEEEPINQTVFKDYDVLKVAHHGSKYSTQMEFLQSVKPEYALISCGKDNFYGHPHEELLERLYEIGSCVKITDQCGSITMKTDGEKLLIEEYLSK